MKPLSSMNYYGDFIAYPALILGASVQGLTQAHIAPIQSWLTAATAGIVMWTLIEYLMHRYAFHRSGPLVALHALHHQSPTALIGAPTWLTLGTLAMAILLPLGYLWSWNVARGFTTGVMAGYLWYVIVHHLVHHGVSVAWLRRLPARRGYHLRHHYARQPGNFGVTSDVWDRIFSTRLRTAGAPQGESAGRVDR